MNFAAVEHRPVIDVIIPAYNEERGLEKVLAEIPGELVREVVVCNNGSTDQTARVAARSGAVVVDEPNRGYGNACLAGIAHIRSAEERPDIVVFIDADHSDHAEEMPDVLDPILKGETDLVIGSRALGNAERGSMTTPQIFGNWLATGLIRMIYDYRFTDLGPFRAIRWETLLELEMQDRTYGWTVEMQVKAAKAGVRCAEVPVSYRRRVGKSKVSGTVKGTLLAGHKILWTIFKLI